MDLATLKPEQWLNDAVLQFWFKWISTPRCPDDNVSSVHICSTYLLSGVLSEGYSERMKKFLKNVNIFEKKIVMFPVHLASHWSLVAVLNPNLIKQTKAKFGDPSYSRELTAMIHLDSLRSRTLHSRKQLAQAVRNVLNAEWRRHHDDALDRYEMPFSHRHKSFQLHCPTGEKELYLVFLLLLLHNYRAVYSYYDKFNLTLVCAIPVIDQGNGYDCGVHVCRYAYNLVQMVDLKVKNKDFTDNFSSCISCHDLFDYNADDINRLRTQMHDLIVHITSLYRNHRDTVIDCLSESDDDDDEDDVEIIYPVTQTSDDSVDDKSVKESNSESSFSPLDDDDDDLSADTTGEFSFKIRLEHNFW